MNKFYGKYSGKSNFRQDGTRRGHVATVYTDTKTSSFSDPNTGLSLEQSLQASIMVAQAAKAGIRITRVK